MKHTQSEARLEAGRGSEINCRRRRQCRRRPDERAKAIRDYLRWDAEMERRYGATYYRHLDCRLH